MSMSINRILRLLLTFIGYSMITLHVAAANADYPIKNTSYQAPWVDGYAAQFENGDLVYDCISGSAGGVEGCSQSYWAPKDAPTTLVSISWSAMDTSACDPYDYGLVDTTCEFGSFNLQSEPGVGGGAYSFTVDGQRCIYPIPPNYNVYDG